MAPVATETIVRTVVSVPTPAPLLLKAPALVLGSPATAQDGSYQKIITELEQTRSVEKLMLDRLLEGGSCFLYDNCLL